MRKKYFSLTGYYTADNQIVVYLTTKKIIFFLLVFLLSIQAPWARRGDTFFISNFCSMRINGRIILLL